MMYFVNIIRWLVWCFYRGVSQSENYVANSFTISNYMIHQRKSILISDIMGQLPRK